MSLLGKAICLFKRSHLLKRRKATTDEALRYALNHDGLILIKSVRYCERCSYVETISPRKPRTRKAKVEGAK